MNTNIIFIHVRVINLVRIVARCGMRRSMST